MKFLGESLDAVRANAPSPIYIHIAQTIDFLSDDADPDDLEGTFGGGFYLVESLADLEQFIANAPCEFDVCEYVDDFLLLCIFTNDAGGDSYFVPQAIVEQCPAIKPDRSTFLI
jgi:hypothetical protein